MNGEVVIRRGRKFALHVVQLGLWVAVVVSVSLGPELNWVQFEPSPLYSVSK